MQSWCEIDLSDLEGACREADTTLRLGAAKAVTQAATEGLAEAKARRRYKDRTWRLTNTATAKPLVASGLHPEALIFWPMPYAKVVDERRGFAGDAHTKAERVLEREVEVTIASVQQRFSR
jgi:hypothetical protein